MASAGQGPKPPTLQGITTPSGDPVCKLSKAGLKVFTEALQHELRNTPSCRISAHLLIPGFVFSGLTARGREHKPDAPKAAALRRPPPPRGRRNTWV